ncbi:MAG TPA: protein TolR [Rickettsiales bacterium]|nr:protein TolR [Rickettsiales bacterium]
MRSRGYRKKSFSEINVTPMVDVMLVLLIIFMVTAPMLTAGVQVDLPKTKAAPLNGQDEPLVVSVLRDGRVYLQDQKEPIALEALGPKLAAITGEKTDTRIFVRGDKDVDYGTIMQVVGEVTSAGLTKVALITEPSQGTSRKER